MIEVRTLFFATAAVFMTLALVTALAWRRNPTIAGLDRVAWAHAAIIPGVVLIALRRQIPDLLSVVVANGLLTLSAVWLLDGVRELWGGRPNPWPRRISLAAVGLCFPYFVYVAPSVHARIVVASAVKAGLMLAAAAIALRAAREPRERSPALLMLASFGGLGALYTARLVWSVSGEPRVTDLLAGDAFTVAVAFGTMTCGVVWTFGVVSLVSERIRESARRARNDLARSEAVSRALLDAMPDLMFRLSADGVFLDYHTPNDGLLAHPPEAFMGRPAAEVLSFEMAGLLFQAMDESRASGGPVSYEYHLSTRDGTEREWEARVTPTPIGEFLVLSRDVTERKRSERAVKELVRVAAHELRNPLTSILGTLDYLASAHLSGEEEERLLSVARRNSERMSSLIDDLLDLERLESGRASFEIESIDLEPLLAQAKEMSEGHAQRAGVTVYLSPVSGVRIRADRQRVLRVLANLLSNAVKFSPAAGSVSVNVFRVDSAVRVAVRDRGPGIPPAFRTRIFERFARGVVPPGHRQGSGLGLAISKALIDGMGGRIGFETDEVSGTTFFFELPEA